MGRPVVGPAPLCHKVFVAGNTRKGAGKVIDGERLWNRLELAEIGKQEGGDPAIFTQEEHAAKELVARYGREAASRSTRTP